MNKDKQCACENKKCASPFSCVLAGAAAGAVMGVIGKILLDSNKKTLKKKADRMMQAMSDLGDSAAAMFQ